MKFSLTAALFASAAVAAPLAQRQAAGPTDADILQFALTLEHLENVFYKGGLSTMPEKMFLDAGFTKAFYDNLKFVAHDEEAHVQLLTGALAAAGASPVAACTYKFPYTDPKTFVTLASVLEGVGTSAYLGAAGFIQDKAYLGVAGSILVTEALHTSLERFNLGEISPANPYGTGLGLNEVFTLAAQFIVSCPSTNVALPVKAFPSLTYVQGAPSAPGVDFSFSTTAAPPSSMFITFVSGLSTTSVAATMKNGMLTATIPTTASGQTYALLTNTNVTSTLMDSMVVAGPAIIEVTPSSPTFDLTIQ